MGKPISQLATAMTLTGAEVLPIVQDGSTRQISIGLLAPFAIPGVPGPPGPPGTTDLAVLNGLDRRILMLASDPAPTDIPTGTIRVAKNTSTGRLSLWANDSGAMVDLLTLNAV